MKVVRYEDRPDLRARRHAELARRLAARRRLPLRSLDSNSRARRRRDPCRGTRSMTITAPVSAYVEPNIWVLYRLDF
jgi:hypothetical protein